MAISAAEQYMLELINRARLDPLGEAARLKIDLNQDLQPGQLHTAARGVLAPEAALELAAIGHSQWMLATDIFSHTGLNNSTPSQRAAAAGYTGWGAGENISWRGTTGTMNLEAAISLQHNDLFVSASHRVNLLWDSYREIGIAQEAGQFAYNGNTFNASMVTQNFSVQPSVYYVTGVVYDDLNGDRFYSIGEGRGGAKFATTGDSTVSASAGGYAVEAPKGGMALVTGTVGALAFSLQIRVDSVNAKLDVVNGTTVHASADVTLMTGLQQALLLGTAAINATGTRKANLLEGNSAANVLSGQAGGDRLLGQGGDDTLLGGGGGDRLFGGAGNDRLIGHGGRDILHGEAGNDTLTGGAGADSFVFGHMAGRDIVTDFSAVDTLRLDRTIWGGTATSAARVLAEHGSVVAGDVVIALGQGHSVTLDGVSSLSGLADQIVLF